MEDQTLRNLAIDLLDDEHGINSQAWKILADMLYDTDAIDILDAVEATDGRYYIKTKVARQMRQVS